MRNPAEMARNVAHVVTHPHEWPSLVKVGGALLLILSACSPSTGPVNKPVSSDIAGFVGVFCATQYATEMGDCPTSLQNYRESNNALPSPSILTADGGTQVDKYIKGLLGPKATQEQIEAATNEYLNLWQAQMAAAFEN